MTACPCAGRRLGNGPAIARSEQPGPDLPGRAHAGDSATGTVWGRAAPVHAGDLAGVTA